LTARGQVFLGVELEMIYLSTSKGRRSRHRNLYALVSSRIRELVNKFIHGRWDSLN
jgi:hypothetical protein